MASDFSFFGRENMDKRGLVGGRRKEAEVEEEGEEDQEVAHHPPSLKEADLQYFSVTKNISSTLLLLLLLESSCKTKQLPQNSSISAQNQTMFNGQSKLKTPLRSH